VRGEPEHMSQNDKLLRAKGLPVLTKGEKDKLRNKWQAETWDDMLMSLHLYGKYIMLRPTGFGKTYTCSCATSIGSSTPEGSDEIILNNGSVIHNQKLVNIHKKKVVFVYVSDILKRTFSSEIAAIKNSDRIIYETYSMIRGHWGDTDYLKEVIDIDNVGLVIFDEVQRLGAVKTSQTFDIATPILNELGVYYIGATATVGRSTGHDVCDKYFTVGSPNIAINSKEVKARGAKQKLNNLTYCWGEHIYTLSDAFKSGLLIPPEYQYIEENDQILKEARHSRKSLLKNLKTDYVNCTNPEEKHAIFDSMQELDRAIIKNSSKIIHDTMLQLYDCNPKFVVEREDLPPAKFGSLPFPKRLPKYMRFLVFAPDRESIVANTKDITTGDIYGSLLERTRDDFVEAFGRYGYKVRTLVISSLTSEERNNVKLLDAKNVSEDDIESEKVIKPTDMTIDLIFSINMLNVGYHVSHITGLVFKRWTGSNQVYYQQLGRCLSVDSDIIPVVFDYVNSISSKGINAPLYSIESSTKTTTENADGTKTIEYKEKPKQERTPGDINIIDAKYITVGMTSATVKDILERVNVYQMRLNSISLFKDSYNSYMDCINIDAANNRLISNVKNIPSLTDSMRVHVIKKCRAEGHDITKLDFSKISMNFKEYLLWLKNNNKDVYANYEAFKQYKQCKELGTTPTTLAAEVNSVLAVSKTLAATEKKAKTVSTNGVNIKLMINANQIEEFKQDKETQDLLLSKGFSPSKDIVTYTE